MKRKHLYLIAFLIMIIASVPLFNGTAFAQEKKLTTKDTINEKTANTRDYKYAIGAAAGFTTGYGLSFRYMPSKLMFQLTFAPYHDSQTDRYSAGIAFLYIISRTKTVNLFLYQADHYYYNSQVSSIQVYAPFSSTPTTTQTRTTDNYFNIGIGTGLEFIIRERFSFNIMLGYAAYNNFNILNLTGETGLYFKF